MAALEQVRRDTQTGKPAATPLTRPWLQVLPHLDPVYGGLSAVVPRLADELHRQKGITTRIAAFCSPGEEVFAKGQRDVSVWPLSRSAWASNRKLTGDFKGKVEGSAGVHIHGLWESSTLLAATAARKAGVPYVLSAHGMLDPWALKNKRWKKLAYAALFERRNVRSAACLHALTAAEAQDYRRFGCRGPIAVIPNGVEANRSATPELFLSTYPAARGKDILLFLGRIHYKKGVDLLAKAWAAIAADFPDALLVLAGPDSEATQAKVQQTISAAHLEHRVLWTGMLDSAMKWSVLAAAACFVLPSYSEGLSVAALEALSMGVPAILSHECHLPQVAGNEAGWLVEPNSVSLADALRSLLSANAAERKRVGENARSLAEREFSWGSVASRMASVYRWVNGGAAPVEVDILQGTA